MDKILRSTKLFVAVLCIFMLCSGIVLSSLISMEFPEEGSMPGYSQIHTYNSKDSYKTISTTDIAVVNLDEGVKLGEKTAYYAQKLITFPNDHFHMTGLDEAKKGFESGLYGAYIIIPSTFSKSVESINDEPEKAIIKYTVNGDNSSSSLTGVVNDINTFASVVSENITYIYVSAILDEYHTAQDNSKKVLENDNGDLDNINSIFPEKLLGEYSYVEEEKIDYNPAEIDLSKYEIDNENIADTFSLDIKNAIEDNKSNFEEIKKQSLELRNETGVFQRFLEEMEPLKDKSGNAVYKDGIKNIEKTISEYNKKVDDSRFVFEDIIRTQNQGTKNILVSEANIHLASESNAIQNYVNLEIDNTIRNAYRTAFEQEYTNFEKNGMERMRLYVEDIISHEMDIDYTQREYILTKLATASDALISQGISQATMSNAYESMMGHVFPKINIHSNSFIGSDMYQNSLDFTAIPQFVKTELSFPEDEIKTALKKDVEKPLENSVSDISVEMNDKASDLNRNYEGYLGRLDDYDPYAHLDESYIARAGRDMERSVNMALSEIGKKQSDDEKFVYDIRRVFDDNLRKYDESINNANETTRQNVIDTVNELRSKKEVNKIENNKLLNDFSNKLAYTRVGSIGNSEAYNFISSPIRIQPNEDSEIEVKSDFMYNTSSKTNNQTKLMQLKGAGSVGGISLIILMTMFLYSLFIKREE